MHKDNTAAPMRQATLKHPEETCPWWGRSMQCVVLVAITCQCTSKQRGSSGAFTVHTWCCVCTASAVTDMLSSSSSSATAHHGGRLTTPQTSIPTQLSIHGTAGTALCPTQLVLCIGLQASLVHDTAAAEDTNQHHVRNPVYSKSPG